MKKYGLIESDLKMGYEFKIETIDKEDYRCAQIFLSNRINKYVIWFNGKNIHSSKTFKSIINRLNKLDKDFPLEDLSVYN